MYGKSNHFRQCDKCYKCELHNYAEVEESVGVQERAEVQAEDTATVQDAVVDEISVTPDAPVVAGVAGMDCKECGDKYEDCRKVS